MDLFGASLNKYLIGFLYVLELHPNYHCFQATALIRVCREHMVLSTTEEQEQLKTNKGRKEGSYAQYPWHELVLWSCYNLTESSGKWIKRGSWSLCQNYLTLISVEENAHDLLSTGKLLLSLCSSHHLLMK